MFEQSKDEAPTPKKLFVVISSDKGLCGGIHSSVTKATRRAIGNLPDSPLGATTVESDSPIMIVGDKSKAQLSRALPQNIRLTFNQIGRDVPTFADASAVADLIAKSGVEYDSVVLVYNKFVSAISYEPAALEIRGAKSLAESSESHQSKGISRSLMIGTRQIQDLRNGGRLHQGPLSILAC